MTFEDTRIDPSTMGITGTGDVSHVSWRDADRALRRIAKSRARLDLEEGKWLLIARAMEAHRKQGFATFPEYIEHVLSVSA